jgi:pimeloyl-ACP methyl ester carboxylesterase
MKTSMDPHTPGIRRRLNGITLHCVEAGPEDGPLVVLLHGFPEFWWGWRHQIAPLAEAGFRVVVPDQRGYNLSDKPEGRRSYHLDTLARDVIALADALGRRTFHLVGHDWGGLVAWWTAACYPDRVSRLVPVNAPHPAVARPYMLSHPSQALRSSYIGFFQIPRLPERILSAADHRGLKQSLRGTSRPGTFSDEDLAHYREAWSKPGAVTAMLNWYRALPSFSAGEASQSRLSLPVLVIWGVRDRFLEKGLAEASLASCDSGEALWIESGSHWVHLEEAEAVSSALVKFLRQPDRPSPLHASGA